MSPHTLRDEFSLKKKRRSKPSPASLLVLHHQPAEVAMLTEHRPDGSAGLMGRGDDLLVATEVGEPFLLDLVKVLQGVIRTFQIPGAPPALEDVVVVVPGQGPFQERDDPLVVPATVVHRPHRSPSARDERHAVALLGTRCREPEVHEQQVALLVADALGTRQTDHGNGRRREDVSPPHALEKEFPKNRCGSLGLVNLAHHAHLRNALIPHYCNLVNIYAPH